MPAAVPKVLGHDPANGLFAMTYLDPRASGLEGAAARRRRQGSRRRPGVGRSMGPIHRPTAGDPAVAARFATDHIFHPIRLEPYLEATARRHPDLSERLMSFRDETLAIKKRAGARRRLAQEHSRRPRRPGLPRCRMRLVWRPRVRSRLLPQPPSAEVPLEPRGGDRSPARLRCVAAAYSTAIDGSTRPEIEARAARLLPGLFLARVDGKSPVEYITSDDGSGPRAHDGAALDRRRRRRTFAASATRLGEEARPRLTGKKRMTTTITQVHGRRVWDSRGRPTVEVDVTLEGGVHRPRHRAGRCFDR